MTLGTYVTVLVRGWPIILITFLTGLVAAFVGTAMATPMYRSTTVLFVSSAATTGDLGSLYQGGLFTQQQILSYAEIIPSPLILQPVIDDLNLDISQEALENEVSVAIPAQTSLVSVSVDDESPAQAKRIANEIGRQAAEILPTLETLGAKGTPTVKVSVVREGDLPLWPSSPRSRLNLILGGMLGLLVGVLLVLLRHLTDRTVRSTAQIEAITGAPVLTEVPQSVWKPDLQVFTSTNEEFSPGHESFYRLRMNLQAVNEDNPLSSVVVTSTSAEDGKSLTAVNLAMALAETRGTVVLVDADLRRPSVTRLLKLDNPPGLSEILHGDLALDEVLLRQENGRLSVLTAGSIRGNPNEMISSAWLGALIEELKDRFDFLVIDAPPLLPVSDAATLSRLADGALIVARYGKTNSTRLAKAVASLRTVRASVVGAVLTFTPDRGIARYGPGQAYEPEDPGTSLLASESQGPVGELNYVLRGYGSGRKPSATAEPNVTRGQQGRPGEQRSSAQREQPAGTPKTERAPSGSDSSPGPRTQSRDESL